MIIDFFNEILNFSLTGPGLWDKEKEESPCPTRSHGNSCRERDEGETFDMRNSILFLVL
jgi:hypothetical protein